MASTIMDLYVNLIGNDVSLIAASKRSAAALNGVARESMTTREKLAKAGAGAALALAAIAGYSVKTAATFQQEMELISTQAGLPQKKIKGLSDSVLKMAQDVGQTPETLAQGLYHIESAGFRGNIALQMLASSAKLTGIGLGNMEDSSQAVIGVMAAMFPDIHNANDAMAILNTTAGIGDMRLADLAKSIGTGVLSSFKTAGLEMKDFSAGMATLTDNVTPPQVAATRLRMAIALLSGPSGVSAKALAAVGLSASSANKVFKDEKALSKYGINMTQLSADLHKPNGLLTAIMDLKTHLKASGLTAVEQSAIITRAFGGARTAAGIELLLNESDRLNTKYKQLGSTSERTKRMQESWANQQKTFAQQMKDLKAGVEVMAIRLGDLLLPILTKIVNFLNQHQSGMVMFFKVLLIFLGLLTAAWVAEGIAMIAANWELILAIAIIAAIAYGVYELFTHWKTVWNWIKGIAKDVWGWLKEAWAATWGFIKRIALDVWHWLVGAWNDVVKAFHATVKFLREQVIDPVVHAITKYLVNPIIGFMKYLLRIWNFMWHWMMIPIKFFIGFFTVIAKDVGKVVVTLLTPIIKAFGKEWNWIWGEVMKVVHLAGSFIMFWVHLLVKGFTWAWTQIVKGATWWWKELKIGWGYVKRDVIDKIVEAAKWVARMFMKYGWEPLAKAAAWCWKMIKIGWGYFKRDVIDKIVSAAQWLWDQWKKFWGWMTGLVSSVWDKIKPIFDKLIGGFDKLKKGISSVMNAPGAAGGKFAHWLGFDKGGRVPGPKGQPHFAVVHGGEYVLSNDMQSGRSPTTGLGSVFSGGPSTGLALAAAGHGGGTDHITVVVDGKALFDFFVQRAQRNKRRNTSTFLT